MKKNLITIACTLSTVALLTACGANVKEETTQAKAQVKEAVQQAVKNTMLFEAHHEGRIYIFDDFATYQDFLVLGETSYRKVRIGEGPRGETIVFGLTNEDKKKVSGIASVDMYDGKLKGADEFYGEMYTEEGRIYVFSSLEEMQQARLVGEVVLRYTDIGAGPKGETVVYALNSSNKKKKPVSLIAKFKAIHAL
ncbi:hypothetical protein [Marinomonas sp. 2405UD68-3]|uniref:hypothetical protein n=1 Tax=Marinomonas sp. 2405UD68-3 TaxID=3391835 RepID=UPI0039C8EAD5